MRRRLIALAAALLLTPAVAAAADDDFTTPAGTWTGTYVCSQGGTGLTLTLDASTDGKLSGTFEFYATKANPGVPDGSFTVEGAWQQSGKLSLHGVRWIKQPDGYGMVSLEGQAYAGEPGEPIGLAGKVTGLDGCTSWGVERR